MRGKRFTEEKIIAVLKEAEAGIAVSALCRTYGISDATYYNWKAKYGGLTQCVANQLCASPPKKDCCGSIIIAVSG
jgi:putative transposase